MGLDGPIPDELLTERFQGHQIAPHVLVREFPSRYLTPYVRRMVRLHRYHARNFHLRNDGVLHWPAKLLMALDLLDRETEARRAHERFAPAA